MTPTLALFVLIFSCASIPSAQAWWDPGPRQYVVDLGTPALALVCVLAVLAFLFRRKAPKKVSSPV